MAPKQVSFGEQEWISNLLRDLDERVMALGRQHGLIDKPTVRRTLNGLTTAHVITLEECGDVEDCRPTLRDVAKGEAVGRREIDKAVSVARAFLAKHTPDIGG